MAKTNFLLYNDMMEQFSLLSREQRGDLIMTIFSYVNGIELPEVEPIVGMAFSFIKARLDKDREAYENKCAQNTENGKKGGRPRKATVSEENQTVTEETEKTERFLEKPKKADIDTDIDTDTKKKTSPTESKKKSRAAFTPPTAEEVREYEVQTGLSDESQAFVDHYTANGWLVGGKSKMKDWKSARRNWERNKEKFGNRDAPKKEYHNRYNDFPQRNNDYKQIEEEWIRRAFGA